MNIIAITYNNIGPFKDKLISVNFINGKYLIKAPIGRGKSFLFFDGPLFALYKYSVRQILNRKSSSGHINLFFEANSEYFLLERQIKSTKTGGEAVQSRMFRINGYDEVNSKALSELKNIINYDIDIYQILLKTYKLDEISFKTNVELQQQLDQIISPREVFVSTNFLMQDSNNIFELIPSERINVFKEIFGLLGIDEAKDKIGEKKREIQMKIKIKTQTSKFDEKLFFHLNQIGDNIAKIDSVSNDYDDKIINENLKKFLKNELFEDLDFVIDKVTIKDFDISTIDFDLLDNINQQILFLKDSYQKIENQLDNFNLMKIEKEEKVQKFKYDDEKFKQEIESLKSKISKLDEKKLENLKKQKLALFEQQNLIVKNIDFASLKSHGHNISDIYDLVSLIDQLTQEGKTLKAQNDNLQTQKESLLKDRKYLEEKLNNLSLSKGTPAYEELYKQIQIKIHETNKLIENEKSKTYSLEQRHKSYTEQLKNLESRLNEINKDIDTQQTYYCKKISNTCPYIQEIRAESLESIAKQKSLIDSQYSQLLVKIKNEQIDANIDKIQKQIASYNDELSRLNKSPEKILTDFIQTNEEEKQNISKQINDFDNLNNLGKIQDAIKDIQNQIDKIKLFLTQIDWKLIKEDFAIYKDLDYKIKYIDTQMTILDEELSKISKYKQDLIQLESDQKSLLKNINDNKNEIIKIQDQVQQLTFKKKELKIDILKHLESLLIEFKTNLITISNLVTDFKNDQLELKQLQEDEKIFNELFSIFSKELMLIVLQEFLPSLSEVINNYLSQIVDYQLIFKLIKSKSEKLELEININDEKGLRSVKSLSGGQKTVLKLVWILAVSSLLRVKFLFLDETINNLDQDTIGKVADLLENFVKSHEMKFYVVTHSRQIQDMAIWEDVVEL